MPKILTGVALFFTLCFSLLPAQAAERYENPKIVINIPSRTLVLYAGEQVIKKYPVGIGRIDHQTPIGKFKIIYKEINPTWVKPLEEGETPVVIPSGPDNPLGYRWMEFAELYGIHGTNVPDSIGGYVSNGCVRMYESDVEELYAVVPLGTPVVITYQRLNIQKDGDGAVTLSVYPDEYRCAPLRLEDVNQKLAQYKAAGIISNERLEKALRDASGEAIRIGRPLAMNVIGRNIEPRGFVQDGVSYLPAVPIATELKLALDWDAAAALLTSPYGSAPGYVKNDILYVRAADTPTLYRLYAKWHPESERMQLNMYNEDI